MLFLFYCMWESEGTRTQVQQSQCLATKTTHTVQGKKKRKKKKNSIAPSIHPRAKGTLGKKVERGVGRARVFVHSVLPLQRPPAGCHYLWLTRSADQFTGTKQEKKWTFLNRGLHLRAMRPHVFVRSCTAAAEKKTKKKQTSSSSAKVWLHVAFIVLWSTR